VHGDPAHARRLHASVARAPQSDRRAPRGGLPPRLPLRTGPESSNAAPVGRPGRRSIASSRTPQSRVPGPAHRTAHTNPQRIQKKISAGQAFDWRKGNEEPGSVPGDRWASRYGVQTC
jgi:hypothetical protein